MRVAISQLFNHALPPFRRYLPLSLLSDGLVVVGFLSDCATSDTARVPATSTAQHSNYNGSCLGRKETMDKALGKDSVMPDDDG